MNSATESGMPGASPHAVWGRQPASLLRSRPSERRASHRHDARPVNRLALHCVGLAVVCSLASCGPDNGLWGSLSEVFPLDVSSVQVLRNEQALQLTYVHNRGAFLDVVARVSISTQGITLQPGAKIALEGEYAPGHQRTTVVHAPGGEPARLLPVVEQGNIFISSGGEIGQVARGNFLVRFAATGGDLGQGRTLGGNFSGAAMDAGFGPLP